MDLTPVSLGRRAAALYMDSAAPAAWLAGNGGFFDDGWVRRHEEDLCALGRHRLCHVRRDRVLKHSRLGRSDDVGRRQRYLRQRGFAWRNTGSCSDPGSPDADIHGRRAAAGYGIARRRSFARQVQFRCAARRDGASRAAATATVRGDFQRYRRATEHTAFHSGTGSEHQQRPRQQFLRSGRVRAGRTASIAPIGRDRIATRSALTSCCEHGSRCAAARADDGHGVALGRGSWFQALDGSATRSVGRSIRGAADDRAL